jgi:hypothetical protein
MNHYRRLIALRHEHDVLVYGDCELLTPCPCEALALSV